MLRRHLLLSQCSFKVLSEGLRAGRAWIAQGRTVHRGTARLRLEYWIVRCAEWKPLCVALIWSVPQRGLGIAVVESHDPADPHDETPVRPRRAHAPHSQANLLHETKSFCGHRVRAWEPSHSLGGNLGKLETFRGNSYGRRTRSGCRKLERGNRDRQISIARSWAMQSNGLQPLRCLAD